MLESFAISFLTPAIQKLPFLDLSTIFQQDGVQTFIDYINVGLYFFPFDTVFSIMGIIIGLHTFRVVIAFFKTVWGVLPVA